MLNNELTPLNPFLFYQISDLKIIHFMQRTVSFWHAIYAFVVLCVPLDAYAYLDPGTGSMLLSVFVGLISSAYFLIRKLPSLLRALFFKFTGKKDDLKNNSIVFYAESAAYWSTFKPILECLAKKQVHVTYLTSAENDPVFSAGLNEYVRAKFIGKGQTAYTALGFLEADVFVLTTPGIDVLQIRRSPGVKKYIHVVHAVGDIHTYKFYSFDYYDAVYCAGPAQAKSLRDLENLRKTTAKELPLLGCPYLDGLVSRRNPSVLPDDKTILIAPTWGANGLLTRTGSMIPKMLASAGFHVILRPHPQSFISDKALMEKLAQELKDEANIEWDRNPDGFKSLSRAQLMISDISGVIFDFAFVFLRPVISVGNGPLKDGFEAWEIPHEAWEMQALDTLGQRILPGDENKIPEAVEHLLDQHADMAKQIEAIRDENVVNFGKAAEPIAQALIQTVQNLKTGK